MPDYRLAGIFFANQLMATCLLPGYCDYFYTRWLGFENNTLPVYFQLGSELVSKRLVIG